jgi:hypothetical protein
MIGLLRDGAKKVAYCDLRPYSETATRHWSLAVFCTCDDERCKCDKSQRHYEHIAKVTTKAGAERITEAGALCVECGG